MRVFYSFGISFYTFLVRIASLRNSKAQLWLKGRKKWGLNLEKIPGDTRPLWIHCSSLGEFEQGRPLIEAIKEKYPEEFILLTFYSPSGYEIRKNYDKADLIMYLPADTIRNARRFIKKVNPKIAVFIKYEFWFNYINELQKHEIPLYSVSAVFRGTQIFFKPSGLWFRKHLRHFTHFFVQNNISESFLKTIGIHKVTVCGDTRVDRVYAISKEFKSVPEIASFSEDSFTVIGGSTWPAEDQLLVQFINRNKDFKLVVAPHELHEKTFQYYEHNVDGKVVRLSQTTVQEAASAAVLIIDSIGLLSSIYKYGQVAVIGGGFKKSIHNILEPAVYGIPVFFGPKYEKFQEAVTMVSEKIAHVIHDYEMLENTLKNYATNNDYLSSQSAKITAFIEGQLGATETVLQELEIKLVK
jgi:3-deoxy-D-manno-octulosonic-acid transferase